MFHSVKFRPTDRLRDFRNSEKNEFRLFPVGLVFPAPLGNCSSVATFVI